MFSFGANAPKLHSPLACAHSCRGRVQPQNFTTFHARTYLQSQLNKAITYAEKDAKGDKNPKDFFECLFKLQYEGCEFKLSILGEAFTDVPQIFTEAKIKLSSNILHYGRVESKDEYFSVLR